MEKIIIQGGRRLEGEINISGMKNSALPVIFSCLLIPYECIIENVPRVSDVYNALKILRSMGAVAEFCDIHTVRINTKDAKPYVGDFESVSKMRASSYLMGSMLSRFGGVDIPMPGGCNFGARPIDLHLRGFSLLGADCYEKDGIITINSTKKLNCCKITLDKISVGATINMVLASVFIDGETIVENVAQEPHVDDLIQFLNLSGAKISRADNCIIVHGVKSLHGTAYRIYPDMIEALTYAIFVGICRGSVALHNVNSEHLSYVIRIMEKMGFIIKSYDKSVLVKAETLLGASVKTAPYPYFPTDIHPQFSALLCKTSNGGCVEEDVFPTRFAYAYELQKMGAKIHRHNNSVYIEPSRLVGAELDATDLRAGASLIAASLGAEGESRINNVKYIVRGYEDIINKIASIGGKIILSKGE